MTEFELRNFEPSLGYGQRREELDEMMETHSEWERRINWEVNGQLQMERLEAIHGPAEEWSPDLRRQLQQEEF